MAIITHDDTVKIILLNSKTVSVDRMQIIEEAENGSVTMKLNFIGLTEDMESYGDCSIFGRTSDNDLSDGCTVNLVTLYKGAILQEALRLSLREAFGYLNKNKIKVDNVYVTDPGCRMTKFEFINFTLIIQNIMKEYKCNATLWMESIMQKDDLNCLIMDAASDKKNKKDKDKKKKKKKGKK